jgi:hypothetical protein
MIVKSHLALCALAILLAVACSSCKQQPATPQPSAAPGAGNSPMPVTTNANATPVFNAEASSADKRQIDACKLLTGDEIKSVQGDSLKEVTSSPPNPGAFITSQCFYATTNFVNSVSLTVTQQSPTPGAEKIRDFWKETFEARGREKERAKERDKSAKRREGEEEEKTAPPERVKGIGDDAYSVGNAKIGALYILKGDKFLRISIGGSRSQPERIRKMKALAQHVIKRL